MFKRPALAADYARMLLGEDPLYNYGRSGLFLSAPRRTGKTHFLVNDLVPKLVSKGALTIYVDLWAERSTDPAEAIARVIRQAMVDNASVPSKVGTLLARINKLAAKFDFEVAGVKMVKVDFAYELAKVGLPQGITLARALTDLHERTGKPLVLLIDEAQHVNKTPSGENALFALKAARDALNLNNDKPALIIVATGPFRGAITDMTASPANAFFGAVSDDLPRLGFDYVRHILAEALAPSLSREKAAELMADETIDSAETAFSMVCSRPETFMNVLRATARQISENALTHIASALTTNANDQVVSSIDQIREMIDPLDPLQLAILKRLAKLGDDAHPFSPEAVEAYAEDALHAASDGQEDSDTGEEAPPAPPASSAQISAALSYLCNDAKLVWKSSGGKYLIDEENVSNYFYDQEFQQFFDEVAELEGEEEPAQAALEYTPPAGIEWTEASPTAEVVYARERSRA